MKLSRKSRGFIMYNVGIILCGVGFVVLWLLSRQVSFIHLKE